MKHTHALRSLLLSIACCWLINASASHVRGGEIHYTHLSGFTYQIDLHLYVDQQTSGPTVPVDPGDGVLMNLDLVQVDTLAGYCAAYRMIYSGQHTYAGVGIYAIQASVMSRSGDVLSIQDPSFQPLCVTADLFLSPLTGDNSSVVFGSLQTDVYYNSGVLLHDLLPSDPDGDSLSYELYIPAGTDCVPFFPYYLPEDIGPAPDSSWVDPFTGLFNWDHPTVMGTFIIAIRCTEWRNGYQVGRVTRDMELCVGLAMGANPSEASAGFQVIQGQQPGQVDVITANVADGELEVLDIEGRIVAHTRIQGPHTTVDLGALAPGTYLAGMSAKETSFARFVLGR